MCDAQKRVNYYRDVYLKSEDWKNLRAAVLATFAEDGKCTFCRRECGSLDVHHMRYRRLYDAKPWELVPLCRECHAAIHVILKTRPDIKEWKPRSQWRFFQRILVPTSELLAKRKELNSQIKICRRKLYELRDTEQRLRELIQESLDNENALQTRYGDSKLFNQKIIIDRVKALL